jgi:hypothetical protein
MLKLQIVGQGEKRTKSQAQKIAKAGEQSEIHKRNVK